MREAEKEMGVFGRAWLANCQSLAVTTENGRAQIPGQPMVSDAACVTMVTGLYPGRL